MDIDPEVYKNARSTRPSWANALIVAACLFGGAVIYTATAGIRVSWWLFAGAFIAALVAGVLALVKMGR